MRGVSALDATSASFRPVRDLVSSAAISPWPPKALACSKP